MIDIRRLRQDPEAVRSALRRRLDPSLDATLTEEMLNQDGTIAAAIQHSLTIETAAPVIVTGSGVAQ